MRRARLCTGDTYQVVTPLSGKGSSPPHMVAATQLEYLTPFPTYILVHSAQLAEGKGEARVGTQAQEVRALQRPGERAQ